MPNTSYSQNALAVDTQFSGRVRGQLISQALVVLNENPPVSGRVAYARKVLNDVEFETQRVCRLIVWRPNLMAFNTSYDFISLHVVTAAGDPDILSQIATDWNILAGI